MRTCYFTYYLRPTSVCLSLWPFPGCPHCAAPYVSHCSIPFLCISLHSYQPNRTEPRLMFNWSWRGGSWATRRILTYCKFSSSSWYASRYNLWLTGPNLPKRYGNLVRSRLSHPKALFERNCLSGWASLSILFTRCPTPPRMTLPNDTRSRQGIDHFVRFIAGNHVNLAGIINLRRYGCRYAADESLMRSLIRIVKRSTRTDCSTIIVIPTNGTLPKAYFE